ncbi:uncharacterized protein [Pagrus major]|uniref:uncharacterized protein n=1 Tax=Pagrus major TaxID=143350 RepID=UPI003CC87288
MKRGAFNFLGRKNQSLFDTNIKMKDMDNVELVLESSAIPESGTASVRARPTVKHHTSSSLDSFQGYAVPTPKVPILPPFNGPKVNGSVSVSNGSVLSIPDLVEGEIFVPPPPSTAPPPPPSFIPPPDFMGDLNSLDLANLQPPSMPAPKLAPFMAEEDLTFLKPPPMAPPKPPSTCSSGSASSIPISSPPVPDYPKFAPPQPPSEKQQKTYKTPPPKPIRLSSISTHDSPPQTPAPPPPVQTPTQSTFNPQNTAKLYSIPKNSILGGYEDRGAKPKQMLLLEDSGSVQSDPVLVQVDSKAPKVATTSKPVSKDVQEPKENLPITQPSPSPLPEPKKEAEAETVSAPSEVDKPLPTIHKTSPQLPKVNSPSEPNKDKFEVTPSQGHRFSPLLDRKLRNLKGMETNVAREGPVASPLALLMAAKERDKQRSTLSLSRENSSKNTEHPSASIQPSDSSPNSFIVTPRSGSSSSLTSQDMIQESPKPASLVEHTQTLQTPQKSSSPALVRDQMPLNSPALNRMAASPRPTNLVAQKQNIEQSPSMPQSTKDENNKEELSMALLPPPPEFDDLDEIMEPPPSIPPPDPPMKKARTPTMIPPPPAHVPSPPPMKAPQMPNVIPPPPAHVPSPPPTKKAPTPTMIPPPPAHVPSPPPMKTVPRPTVTPPPPPQVPAPPPKPKPPAPPTPPKLPPPHIDVKPKPQDQTKPKVALPQLPPNLSPSQATLLSILQKKMLEMDHKMAPMKEAESSSDDWGTPLSDEDSQVPVVPWATPQSKNTPVVNKAATLDMRELEGKVIKKYQDTSSVKVPTSNGPSKHQFGRTFTVRPGTKEPITLVRQGES